MFLYYFNVLISEIFFKKYIILIYFKIKNILKNNHYYTFKPPYIINHLPF